MKALASDDSALNSSPGGGGAGSGYCGGHLLQEDLI